MRFLSCMVVLVVVTLSNTSASSSITRQSNNEVKVEAEIWERLESLDIVLQSTIKELSATKAELSQVKSDLQDKESILLNLVKALVISSSHSIVIDDKSNEPISVKKRDATGEDESEAEDTLSTLSLNDMIPLISKKCRDGRDGEDGRDGRDGAPGAPGAPGHDGDRGAPGDQGPPGVMSNTTTGGGFGSVYTRWGRTDCPRSSALIYEGFMAGTHHTANGGAANHQCLPLEPEYNSWSADTSFTTISGTEYQGVDPLYEGSTDQNVPCARCYSNNSAVMMIPAKRKCPEGWNKEYEGYLMAGHASNKGPSSYRCVDQHPEHIQMEGEARNTNGALLYFIKPDCEGTQTIGHCPPYDSTKQLTCVVCTK